MRKSQNFDLNLYEGTDIFNPLTNDVPNYEKIDEQMKKNYNLSVGKATELKTGTVHALTRENADCPMIHFTATSNFTSNDTFTVDGVQVSALLVDGSTLPSNCYIIGSEVICYLKGTLLTFFLSGSTSKDSEKLGGELPSYYAKKQTVDELSNTVDSYSDLVQQNSNDIISLKNYKDKYLLNEFKTNKTWIDGKAIYRKVIDFGALPVNSNKVVDHNIQNIDTITNYSFIASRPSDGATLKSVYQMGETDVFSMFVSNTSIVFNTTGDFRSYKKTHCIIEYTKKE